MAAVMGGFGVHVKVGQMPASFSLSGPLEKSFNINQVPQVPQMTQCLETFLEICRTGLESLHIRKCYR